MCDYSLQSVRSRPAKVGDKLTTRDSVPGHVGSPRRKTMPWRSAFFQGPSLRFPARLQLRNPASSSVGKPKH